MVEDKSYIIRKKVVFSVLKLYPFMSDGLTGNAKGSSGYRTCGLASGPDQWATMFPSCISQVSVATIKYHNQGYL